MMFYFKILYEIKRGVYLQDETVIFWKIKGQLHSLHEIAGTV